VDIEEYFQVSAFEAHIPAAQWWQWPSRVVPATERLLDMFAAHQAKATFFTLASVAQQHPHLIKRLVAEGHELASHGCNHQRVSQLTPAQFRQDVRDSKQCLEDLSGQPVLGYRAPSYSINHHTGWALTVLQEQGYRYSSSIYPIRHDLYGAPQAPRTPFYPEQAPDLLEIPLSTLRLAGRNWPCAGGGFFRLYPYALSRWAYRQQQQQTQQPSLFYCHPWELDVEQPRPNGLPLKTRVRHYLNLHRMPQRLERLLSDFRWNSLQAVFLPGVTTVARP
jgi:polysaccharide deacetylase family protein (PEP-CTERM system associated)